MSSKKCMMRGAIIKRLRGLSWTETAAAHLDTCPALPAKKPMQVAHVETCNACEVRMNSFVPSALHQNWRPVNS